MAHAAGGQSGASSLDRGTRFEEVGSTHLRPPRAGLTLSPLGVSFPHPLPPLTRISALACALAAAALLLRLHAIDESILTFHPTRQYRSAIIARACYHDARPDLPESLRRVSRANRAIQPVGEPPLLEWTACAAYRFAGDEPLAIPRSLSALAWVAGSLPLYLIAQRLATPAAALVSLAVYLFAPYGIVASRAFQPDPLMTLCALLSLWTLLRHDERPTLRRLLVAGLAMAVAAVVKPMSVFLTVLPAIGLTLTRVGIARGVFDRSQHSARGSASSALSTRHAVLRLLCLLSLGLLPAVLYYGHSTIFGTLARDQWQMRFVPSLLTSSFFFGGVATQIAHVFGWPLFIVGLLGACLATPSWARAFLLALWLGYALFAVAFTYHVPTHDYYHLPYLTAAGLGAAVVTSRLSRLLADRWSMRPLTLATASVAIGIAALGAQRAWPMLTVEGSAAKIEEYGEIGKLAAHDDRVLFLDREYGYPLMYHAEIAGDSWPSTDDLAAEAIGGEQAISAATRFDRDFADYAPRFFVVTDLDSLAAQPDLQALLVERTDVVARRPTFHVYRFHANSAR